MISNPSPVDFGVQSAMLIPFGTYRNAMRFGARPAACDSFACATTGPMASNQGSASETPRPRSRVRLGIEGLVKCMVRLWALGFGLWALGGSGGRGAGLGGRGASFAKGIALDDLMDEGLHAVLLFGHGLSDVFDDGSVIVFYSASEGVGH